MITEPREQAEYMAAHWWDHFNFTDTLFLSQPDAIEQAFVDYIVVLPHLDPAKASAAIQGMMRRAEADPAVYAWFREQAEHYLWDPNSPMRNEDLYIYVLESVVASDRDPLIKQRAAYQLAQAQKNRPGTVAADFSYTLATERTGRLSQLKSEYTLLFFNNPGCSTCAQIMGQIGASPVFNALLATRPARLTVLAVYTDEDLAAWREYLPGMPAGWIVSHSREPEVNDLYDLRAIPTMYLLDADKKVLLKDPTFEQLEAWLVQQNTGN
jgi:thioredoxin-related protein